VKSLAIAAALAIALSGAFVGWPCHSESRDACYIAQGMAPYVAGVLLIVLWPLAAGARALLRGLKTPRPDA